MPPSFGYVLDHYGSELKLNPELLENRTRNVESIGFDSVWVTDHILLPKGSKNPQYEKITEIITTMAHLGGITSNIDIGMSTLVLPARDTILAAKQISTLHYFLGDRLIPSFGAGWAQSEFKLLDQNFTNRGKRFDEQLQVIRDLFQGKDQFKGEFHDFSDSELLPRRSGLDKLPFYIAGNSEHAVKRAIKYGDGWHPINLSAEKISDFLDTYDKLHPQDIILRLKLDDDGSSVEKQVEPYIDLGIDYVVFDDDGNLQNFEKIIQYVRSFQEFQP